MGDFGSALKQECIELVVTSSASGKTWTVTAFTKDDAGDIVAIEVYRATDRQAKASGHDAKALAMMWRTWFSALSSNMSALLLVRAFSALQVANDCSRSISRSDGEPGNGNYATKNHMRSWATEIFDAVNPLIIENTAHYQAHQKKNEPVSGDRAHAQAG